MKKTTQGLDELLIRHGVTPTYELKKDIEMAREFMPKPYSWSEQITQKSVLQLDNKLNKQGEDL
jgi:hypothetical protein